MPDITSVTMIKALMQALIREFRAIADQPIAILTVFLGAVTVFAVVASSRPDILPAILVARGPKKNSPPIPPPTTITSLRVYPIKSCRGIEVQETKLGSKGLSLDRNWMFISKDDRKFLTIRSDANMTLIDTAIVTDENASDPNSDSAKHLRISIHGKPDATVTIPAFPTKAWLDKNTTLSTVEIWEQETDGYEYSDSINKIFSDFFAKPVSLIYKGPTSRNVAVNGRKDLYGSETAHHFADVMSVLIASDASIADLNARLDEKSQKASGGASKIKDLTIERFRPNIIVSGRPSHPWEEDTWKRVRLSTHSSASATAFATTVELDVVARCARCQVPNVDPDTAAKHPKEPWDELMKFRRVDDGGAAKFKPCFGMLCIPKGEGWLKVGGQLEVLETTGAHRYNEAKFKDL